MAWASRTFTTPSAGAATGDAGPVSLSDAVSGDIVLCAAIHDAGRGGTVTATIVDTGTATDAGFTQETGHNSDSWAFVATLQHLTADGAENDVDSDFGSIANESTSLNLAGFYDDAAGTIGIGNIGAANYQASGTTSVNTALNVSAGSRLVIVYFNDGVQTMSTPPAGMTELYTFTEGSTKVHIYYEDFAGADTAVTRTATFTGTDQFGAMAIELTNTGGGSSTPTNITLMGVG